MDVTSATFAKFVSCGAIPPKSPRAPASSPFHYASHLRRHRLGERREVFPDKHPHLARRVSRHSSLGLRSCVRPRVLRHLRGCAGFIRRRNRIGREFHPREPTRSSLERDGRLPNILQRRAPCQRLIDLYPREVGGTRIWVPGCAVAEYSTASTPQPSSVSSLYFPHGAITFRPSASAVSIVVPNVLTNRRFRNSRQIFRRFGKKGGR